MVKIMITHISRQVSRATKMPSGLKKVNEGFSREVEAAEANPLVSEPGEEAVAAVPATPIAAEITAPIMLAPRQSGSSYAS